MIVFGEDGAENLTEYPFVLSIAEGEDNRVSFTVALASVGEEEADIDDRGLPAPGEILQHVRPVFPDKTRMFEITFEQYILWQVRNESYCSWDPYEIWHGTYFLLFEQSRLLDTLPQITDCFQLHTGDYYPGEWKHYGILCQNHIIDIISCNEPTIRSVGGRKDEEHDV